jgi:hypothetical protein
MTSEVIALMQAGMAPRIVNLAQWRGYLLTQLQRRGWALGDQRLSDLHDELVGYPGGNPAEAAPTDVVLPLRYLRGGSELSFFSISAAVGTATDVTVEELAIEAFYPADAATMAALRPAAGQARRPAG